jgi:hypothetical protein
MKHLTPHVTDRITERAVPYTPLILRVGAVVLALGVGCRTARGEEPRHDDQAPQSATHSRALTPGDTSRR